MSLAITNQCPNCGGIMSFNAEIGQLECLHCGTTFSQEAAGQESVEQGVAMRNDDERKRDASQAQIPLDPDAPAPIATSHAVTAGEFLERAPWEIGTGGKADESLIGYTCPSCGAHVIADQSTVSTWCPYCDNNMLVSGIATEDVVPQKIFPFAVTKKQALESIKAAIEKKKYAPKNLVIKVEHLEGVYVPYWAFDISTEGQIGKRTSVDAPEYTTHALFERVPVDGSSKMPDSYMDALGSIGGSPQAEWAARMLGKKFKKSLDLNQIDWEESSSPDKVGHFRQKLNIRPVDGGSSRIVEARDLEGSYWEKACDFDASYVAGYLLEVPDESAEECFDRACLDVEATLKQDAKIACTKMGKDDLQLTGYVTYTLENATLYAVPVWLLHCDCNGEDVLVAASGLDTEWCIGDFPVSNKRRVVGVLRSIPGALFPSLLLAFFASIPAGFVMDVVTALLESTPFALKPPNALHIYLFLCAALLFLQLLTADRQNMIEMHTTKRVHQADWCYGPDGLVVSNL